MNKQDIISALVDSHFDLNQDVSQAAFNSLLVFSGKEINTVLLCCLTKFNDPKFNMRQTTEIFKCIRLLEKITQELSTNELDSNINTNLVLFSINILKKLYDSGSLKDNDLEQQCETIISNILTNIGKTNCDQVVNELLKQFSLTENNGNSNEQAFVIKTLGNMCIINPIGINKFIKSRIIQELWPLIKVTRTDGQRLVLAHTIACVGTAILENLANDKGRELKEEHTESNQIEMQDYEKDFDLIFDVLLTWLQTKDNRTKEQVIKALGIIFQLMSKNKFIENQNRLIELLLSFYRKNISIPFSSDLDSFYTTQSLTQFLNVCLEYDCGVMNSELDTRSENEIDMIMNILFRQSLIPINPTQPTSVNNHNEILRTFSILSIKNCSKVVNFILRKFEENSIAVKISGLSILKHLIDTRTTEITEKFSSIFFALRNLVDEENNKLKKMLIQVIVSIAYRGYLSLDAKFLIQFILKQCAKDVKDQKEQRSSNSRRQSNQSTFNSINQDQNSVSNATLKQMAENVLPLLVNTVDSIEQVLWPQLFEYLVLPEYVNATGIICDSLFKMGERLKEKNDKAFNFDFTEMVHLPKGEEIMARLVILIGDDPLKSNENIKSCLNLMKVISPLIHPNLETLWTTMTNQYLDILNLDEQLTKQDWMHKCLALVNQSFIEIDSEDFTLKFGKHLLDHLHFYNNSIDLKYFLLLVLASIVRRINQKSYTEKIMDEVFSKIDHSNETERDGCALLFGHCSAQFLDLVIVKLEKFYYEAKKGNGIISSILSLGLRSDKRDADEIKSTIILSYGYMTKYAQTSLLITRIETPILISVIQYYELSEENPIVQEAFVKACKIIAISMRPENLKMIYMLKARKVLIYDMINIAKQESTSLQTKIEAIEVLGLLFVLDPVLNDSEKRTLIGVIAKIIFTSNDDQLLKSFHLLIKNLLVKESKNTQNLSILFEIINPYAIALTDEIQRLNIMNTFELILDEFNKNIVTGDFVKLESYCYLCALILPYCCDELEPIRTTALECICKLAIISVRLQSKNIEDDELIERLTKLTKQNDLNLESLINELSTCMVTKLRKDNIHPVQLIIKLISSLNYKIGLQKKYGTSTIALVLTKSFINELRNDVHTVIDTIYQTRLDNAKTNIVLVSILSELASNHLNLFCNHLVSFPLPFDDHLSKFWRSLSESNQLSKHLIGWCIEKLNEDDLIIYDKRKTSNAICKPECMNIICGLNEIFKNQQVYDIVHSNSDKIFSALISTISSYINVDYLSSNPRRSFDQEFVNLPFNNEVHGSSLSSASNISNQSTSTNISNMSTLSNNKSSSSTSNTSVENVENSKEIRKFKPIKCAILTLKQYLNLLKYDTMLLSLESEGCFKLMEEPNQFYFSICILAKSIYNYQPSMISKLVKPFTQSLNHKEINRRLVPLAFFSYLLSLNSFPDKETLNEPFLNTVLNMCNDSSPIVRLYCVKGLGTIDQLNHASSFKFVLPVVSALVNSLDDSDDSNDRIKHEALNSLCLVLAKINLKLIQNLVTNLVLRLKSFFNRDKFYIREKSVEAVGHLMKNNDLKEIILDESSNLIIHLLITLNDSVIDVVKATKFTLMNVSKVLDIETLSVVINKHLVKENLHYNEIVYQIAKLMVNEFNDHLENFVNILLVYLKLDDVRVQCNSLQILGSLFGNDANQKEISDDLRQKTVLLIIHFLKDSKNLELRVKAAEILINF